MCIVNIRRVYTINKNKVSLIIWPPTVNNTLVFFYMHTYVHTYKIDFVVQFTPLKKNQARKLNQ